MGIRKVFEGAMTTAVALLLVIFMISFVCGQQQCNRTCTGQTLTCRYTFTLEWYLSLSKACYNCPNVTWDCFRPDCIIAGGLQRSLISINRMLPGPMIEVCEGDRVQVQIVNNLGSETTSIHWHGQHQEQSPYMDGVPFITQCPISPHSNFTYSFTASVPGTHFYHSHTGSQRGDGLYGVFIVRTPPIEDQLHSFYDYDLSSHTIVMSEWSQQTRQDAFLRYYHGGQQYNLNTILINGIGYFPDRENNTNWPIPRFTVTRGSRYRFRVINAAFNDCPLEMSIDNHNLTMVSSDGEDFSPITMDSFMSYGGERFDFILNANQPISQYWMRFRGGILCQLSRASQVAILQYVGSENMQRPRGPLPRYEDFRSGEQFNNLYETFNNLISATSLRPPDLFLTQTQNLIRRYIEFDFNNVDNPMFHRAPYYGYYQVPANMRVATPQFDRISYVDPPRPLLQNRFSLRASDFCNPDTLNPQQHCEGDYCECVYMLQVPLYSIVELILIDVGNYDEDAIHPIHLHGHSFRVLGSQRLGRNSTIHYVRGLDALGLLQRNYRNPPLKDTIGIPHGGYTIIRFSANNPGFWFLHCHIDTHLQVGMGIVLQVGNPAEMQLTPTNFPTCGSFTST